MAAATVHDERVAVTFAGPGDRRDRVVNCDVPGQPHTTGDGRTSSGLGTR